MTFLAPDLAANMDSMPVPQPTSSTTCRTVGEGGREREQLNTQPEVGRIINNTQLLIGRICWPTKSNASTKKNSCKVAFHYPIWLKFSSMFHLWAHLASLIAVAGSEMWYVARVTKPPSNVRVLKHGFCTPHPLKINSGISIKFNCWCCSVSKVAGQILLKLSPTSLFVGKLQASRANKFWNNW